MNHAQILEGRKQISLARQKIDAAVAVDEELLDAICWELTPPDMHASPAELEKETARIADTMRGLPDSLLAYIAQLAVSAVVEGRQRLNEDAVEARN